jgi:hypothetical protein
MSGALYSFVLAEAFAIDRNGNRGICLRLFPEQGREYAADQANVIEDNVRSTR